LSQLSTATFSVCRNKQRETMARNGWASNEGWEEKNWDAVTKQEQKKQELLVKASQNSDRIRQMVREVDQTRNMAGDTLNTLDEQSEQIKRMHGEYDKVEANLNFADRTIRGMESMWGSMKNWMTKAQAERARPPSAGAAEGARLDKASAARKAAGGAAAAVGDMRAGSRTVQEPKQYGDDWKGKLTKMEDQQDSDLDDLSRMVNDLKGMGKDMGYAIETQNTSLDRLGDRTDVIGSRLATSEKKIGKMLGR